MGWAESDDWSGLGEKASFLALVAGVKGRFSRHGRPVELSGCRAGGGGLEGFEVEVVIS